ncbi:hypothetical protein [Mammaliicoccus fleurettii]|uniref:hypothetical protein n=1 Tax=Mammaliicoccus fleurettii TaxID=150056 RepID=UPI000993DAC2|nr:hypothetical protein [Mammaliicoccus fleurettii]OOV78883.1 hypothetical protein B2G86_00730 [Mammaliicoccus fleurettii]
MKRFKYCTDKEMDRAVKNYNRGGNTNYIYVLVFENGQVETIEVSEWDMHLCVFDSEEEMHEFFNSEPKVKDLVEGQQLKLF